MPGRHTQEETDVSILLDCQSGTDKFNVTISTGQKDLASQNVSFADQNPAYTYTVDSVYDPTRSTTDSSDATLEHFFSRPLKIATYSWTTSVANFTETFNPWKLYWEDKRVINRISNYNLLRTKMHIKIVINGNGFHYGRLIASYNPLHTVDDLTVDRGFFSQDIIQASQRPHVYLDPTTSQGGSLLLPFFWHKNSLGIPNNEWSDMGQITITEMAQLKHANGADDRVTISVFAWAEEVSMSMPTSSTPGTISPQCGEEPLDPQAKDEFVKDGSISVPASNVARVAGALSSVPVIGPFAKATEMAASGVSNIAKVFGYSRPAVLSDVSPYKPTVMGNLSNSNAADSVQSLALDSKQEVTIDPRVTGLSDVDEMTIKSIACRESYLTKFPWRVQDEAETALFSCIVNPVVWDTLSVGGGPTEVHMPACCFAALPFLHWRGTMKYRFQVVSSNFHKGRLKIVWDPFGLFGNEYNTQYTQIVDIADTKDFTVDIGWGNELSYLTHRSVAESKIFINGSLPIAPGNTGNGLIAVYVVNDLTVPNSDIDNDISVNVFVSAGDDFEVANPESIYIDRLSWFRPPEELPLVNALEEFVQHVKDGGDIPSELPLREAVATLALLPGQNGETEGTQMPLDPQSGSEAMPGCDKDDTVEPSAPMQDQAIGTLGQTQDCCDQMTHVHYGEAIVSFRQCLKRYNLHTITGIGVAGPVWFRRTQNNMPYHRGYAPGAIHGSFNYSKMTLLNYLLPAYTGYRGSTRWKYQLIGSDANTNSLMSVTRKPFNTFPNGYEQTAVADLGIDTETNMSYEAMLRMPDAWPGTTATATRINPVVEVELPYMSNLRFGFAKEANMTTSGFNDYYHRLDVYCSDASDTTTASSTRVACYNATGEDFGLYFFTGAPIAYYSSTLPPPPQ